MKKIYYYIENDIQYGPFSIQELNEKKIHKRTLVWTEEMENWEEANNVKELKGIFKFSPPPIPTKTKKPIKVEAKISRKKEKIITPKGEILIANEIKLISKFAVIALIIGCLSYPVFLNINNGFKNKNLVTKLEILKQKYSYELEKLNKGDFKVLKKLKAMEDESGTLEYESSWLGNDIDLNNDFNINQAIDFHNSKFKEIQSESIYPSMYTAIIGLLILIMIRYLIKAVKWINRKSKST